MNVHEKRQGILENSFSTGQGDRMDDNAVRALLSRRISLGASRPDSSLLSGRGEETPESDLDLLVVYSRQPEDVFEAAYEIRRQIHEQLNIAVDVVVTTRDQFDRRRHQTWTIEHTAEAEGIAV